MPRTPRLRYFPDRAAALSYVFSELLATLEDDLDRMSTTEREHYTSDDRTTMRRKIHDIRAIEAPVH